MASAKKVAVVTGGSSGIGRATVEVFARRGYSVASLDIVEPSAALRRRVLGASPRSIFIKCDVSREEEVRAAVDAISAKYGRADCLINIAGVVLVKPLAETSWDEYRRTMDVNFGGVLLMCKHVVPLMKKRGGGSIVNAGSVSGHVGQVRHAIYGATKGAIISFTRALAWELAPERIRVNSFSPGSVDTPMLRSDVRGEATRLGVSFDRVKKEREAEQAFGRWASPREIAEAIYFLATDSGSFVTGADLLVDCGWTAK